MPDPVSSSALAALRRQVESLEGQHSRTRQVLPFGVNEIDRRLAGGGLVLGALHEVAGAGVDAAHAAAAGLFVAGIAARLSGKVLWCVTRQDLFAPALEQAGLSPDRVIFIDAGDEKALMTCFEEGLRHGGLAAVVAEIGKLSMIASRRLQLASEKSGTMAIALRRCHRRDIDDVFSQPTASMTRWRIGQLPSAPLPVPGIGRPHWRLQLVRCRGGESAEFEVEACDAKGCIAFPSKVADRPAATKIARRFAAV
ncbi:ImuA family protein [Allorhizobium taibaishanense]|uniref:Damage-inducible protein n=1 Tax=Allorhizobium taibaishanense TaxID=887144 RepID=A0A1Q9A664_9HYPH|nr:damage-inducible protein [Allorhizobium taibaishanense]MBB4008843.1 protein ImuA [Allorhizobium taibaishanense]OLP50047.1 damage-inducible protein [Allorhizobium taibaishanense]